MFAPKPRDACGRPMCGTMVHNPEHPPSFIVRRLTPYLVHEPIERFNSAPAFAAAKQLRPVNVQGCQIRPGSTAFVFVFDLHGGPGPRRKGCALSATCLNARLLVCRQNKLVIFETASVPAPFIQVENAPGLVCKLRVPWENPATVLPGSNRILVKPSPYRGAADRCPNSGLPHSCGEIPRTPAGKRHAKCRRQLTGLCLNLDHQVRGKKPGGDPGEDARPARPDLLQKTSCAINRQPPAGFGDNARSLRFLRPRPQAGSFWPVGPESTVTYISEIEQAVPVARLTTELSGMGFFSAFWLPPLPTRMPQNPAKFKKSYVSVFTNMST